MIALSTWQRKFASDLLAVLRPARTLARDPSQNGPCEGHVRTYDKHNHGFGGVSAPLYRAKRERERDLYEVAAAGYVLEHCFRPPAIF